VIPQLAQNHEVYALDLLGFGLSAKPADGGYSLADQGQLVLAFINELQLQQPTIVGHSMGGVITALAAAQSPEKIGGLVMIDAGIYHGGPPAFLKYLFFPFDVIAARSFYTKGARTRSLQRSYYNQSMITDELVDKYLEPAGTPGAAAVVAKMNKFSSVRYTDVSRRLRVATLLVWGRYDMIVPVADAERLHQEIRGSQLVVIDYAGHMVQEEKPKEVAAAILKFLEQ
jgi:pimeloyl-ACP methyl ester carboxylesterase